MHAMSQPPSSTSTGLVRRVQAGEPEAWDRFAIIYTPLLYAWARRGGLQPSDAEDVVQDVFRSVLAKIDQFQQRGPDAGLRSWLWAVTRNRVRLHFRERAPQPHASGGSDAAMQLANIPDVWQRDEEPSTTGDREALVHRALALVKNDFAPDTWQAFWRLTVDGHAVADIAAELGLTTGAVRQAKYRVLGRLRDEIGGL